MPAGAIGRAEWFTKDLSLAKEMPPPGNKWYYCRPTRATTSLYIGIIGKGPENAAASG
jgi:hypothetical protein